jgi:iduronate 2-sulfatase
MSFSRNQHVGVMLVSLVLCSAALADESKPNVLFIAVDDLRPQLGCYGFQEMHTPNLDRLAARGVLFERAYCMVPTCGASRASLMTGIRPTRNRFVNFQTWAEKDAKGIITLNTHFKENGYTTISNGKIFHHSADSAAGWSEPAWRPKDLPTYQLPKNAAIQRQRSRDAKARAKGPAFESADVADNVYADGQLVEKSIKDLQHLAQNEKPFFLAVGFFRPHLPFVAPKKYWDLYDPETISLPETYHPPKDAPFQAIHNSGELRGYSDIPAKGPLTDAAARNLIHGYYACVSYTDAQIGKLLDELDRLQLARNTVIVLWGDHGWNLGEHTLWCKHSCFETSMHAPLIVAAPGIEGGKKTVGLTEFVDVYPSLCELAGIGKPSHLQGKSFVPLLREPIQQWKSAAIGRYRTGDTIRTDKYRYTQYSGPLGKPQAQMLYDHTNDSAEDVTIAEQPKLKPVVDRMLLQLRDGMGKD